MIAPKQIGNTATFADITANGALAVMGTVEQYRALVFTQATPGVSVTLPSPQSASIIFSLPASNKGSVAITVEGVVLPPGQTMLLAWDGASWDVLGNVVPTGGTTGQVYTKNSNANFDASWKTLAVAPTQIGSAATIADIAASGAITVTGAIEQYRGLVFTQTTANIAVTLPSPQNTALVFWLPIAHKGTAAIAVQGVVIYPGHTMLVGWDGASWDVLGNVVPPGGTSGQVLAKNSNSDFDVSWKTPTSGPGVLNTIDCTGISPVTDQTSFLTGYTIYEIDLINVVPSDSGPSMRMQWFTTDGLGAGSTNGYVTHLFWGDGMNSASGSYGWVNTNDFFLPDNLSNVAGSGVHGKITIYNPASTTTYKKWTGEFASSNASGDLIQHRTVGISTRNTLAVTGFKLATTSGQAFSSGKVIVRAVA
ncbi:hypothetical protein [Methylocystis heyeri]|uniref:Uncharacterized protein n=1 Tax=Methylocystis heyeri TaxID=391905 RepID=A0A6B8KGL2_9HYPH|nr:hypothetical protein [Methylocystis heyeri]QGM46115.1 hypothetical protein H2LOC_010650 [Methylocystis heyeri]